MSRLFTRAIRPPDPELPNANDPASVQPATVGPPSVNPGDPHGVTFAAADPPPSTSSLAMVTPSAWSGWPADWSTPYWGMGPNPLADTAWMCIDLNANVLSSMPPYLVGAAPTLSADWLNNPDPDLYSSWEEFAKNLFWDYQLGEAFVLATAYYATGWPARFHVVPPWFVQVSRTQEGTRRYTIGAADVTSDILHIRYQASTYDLHGHGPLEAGAGRVVAAQMLAQYATTLAANGGIPAGVLEHTEELSAEQAALLQAQWVQARMSSIGEPAVLSGGVKFTPTQVDPEKMALVDLAKHNESRIAVLLGVPPVLVGLPSGGDPMTYRNITVLFDYHWRGGLRPKANFVMAALSGWLLPRQTRVEVNRDEYVQPDPLQRAQVAQIYNSIRDPQGTPVLSVEQIQAAERISNSSPAEPSDQSAAGVADDLSSGVLK